MGYLPELTEGATTRLVTDTFYGYDRSLCAGDGTWVEETGLSTRAFPMLATRRARAKVHLSCGSAPERLLCKDRLAWVGEDGLLYYDAVPVEGIALTPGEKTLVSMGAYLCVFPDGVYVNTQDLRDAGTMGNRTEVTGEVRMTMCDAEGEAYDPDGEAVIASVAPEDPANGQYWIDTGGGVHTLKRYSSAQGAWTEIPTVYVKIEAKGIGSGFREQDAVRISGLHCFGGTSAAFGQAEDLNTDAVLEKAAENYIIIPGVLDRAVTVNAALCTVERRVPKLDFVCELDNRLWGCRYGTDGGETVNTIYATAQGDCRNWFRYAGVSTDSYAVNVGSDGPFTGMIAYGGYVLAFKERCMHKIYGTLPENFTVSTVQCRGVAESCGDSLAIVNETLYYLSRSGVTAYDGSAPAGVSDAFAGEAYSDGRAGAMGSEYVICMKDGRMRDTVWSYDTARGIWHHLLDEDVRQFVPVGSDLFALDADGTVWSMSGAGNGGDAETDVPFDAVSALIGYEYPEHKYLSRFVLRVQMNRGDELEVLVRYGLRGEWESQGTVRTDTVDSCTLPVIPRRCDTMQLRLRGHGDVRVLSIAKILETGSDAE